MRDRVDGVRRDSVAKHDGLGPHTKIPRPESLQAQSWTPHKLTQSSAIHNAINPFLDDGWTSA